MQRVRPKMSRLRALMILIGFFGAGRLDLRAVRFLAPSRNPPLPPTRFPASITIP